MLPLHELAGKRPDPPVPAASWQRIRDRPGVLAAIASTGSMMPPAG